MATSDSSPQPWLRAYQPDGTPLPDAPLLEGVRAAADEFAKDRTVALETLTVDGREVTISTVFLVFDAELSPGEHVPQLYETAIVIDGQFTIAGRCASREQALTMHARTVEDVRGS